MLEWRLNLVEEGRVIRILLTHAPGGAGDGARERF